MRDPEKFTQDDNIDRFIEVHNEIDRLAEEKSELEREKKKIAAVLATQFGESMTSKVERGGRTISTKKFVTAAADDGLRPALIEAMAKHEETKDMIKPNLHGGTFNSWVAKHDELGGMMTAEELHGALPEWMQKLVHVNAPTVAVATKVGKKK